MKESDLLAKKQSFTKRVSDLKKKKVDKVDASLHGTNESLQMTYQPEAKV